MNLLRKVKLSEIIQIEFTQEESEIINSIDTKLSDLILYKDDNYIMRDFYINKNSYSCVLEHHKITDIIYVNVNIINIINTDLIHYFIKKKYNISSVFSINYFKRI